MLNNTYGGDKITFHYRYRKQIIIASVLLLIIGITIYFFLTIKPTKTSKKETEPIFNIKEEKKPSQESTIKYQVDIKGEVINPGIYTMDSSSRVIDQTTPNMIQRISGVFERKPLILKEI